MRHIQSLIACLLFCIGIYACSSSKKEQAGIIESQKIELGVWQDATNKVYTVNEIREWMKPFYEAGITNFYICSSPESIARYIEAAKAYNGAKIHAWIFALNACNDPETFKHKDWFEVNRLGENSLDKPPYVKIYKWLSPAVPAVKRNGFKDKGVKFARVMLSRDCIQYTLISSGSMIWFLGRWSQQDVFHIDQTTYEGQIYDFGYHPQKKAIEAFKQPRIWLFSS